MTEKKTAKLLNRGVALFEKKAVYGVDRFYPKNDLAFRLVELKQAAAQQNRKRHIKCLALRELEIVQKMGILTEF